MNIKKLILGLLLVVIIGSLGIGYKIYKNHIGENYYVQLINEPVSCKENKSEGSVECKYKEKGYNEEGGEKIITFTSNIERPLRKDAYLLVVYNNSGNYAVKYKEVKKDEIPKKALEKLEKNKLGN